MAGTLNKIIYLDNNATTPCDPQVVEKMLPFFTEIYGNPSNGFHWQGRKSANAIDEARETVASFIGASFSEIFFTSGATESNNLAILGYARKHKGGNRKKIITSAIEHKAVLATCKKLGEEGFEIGILPTSNDGLVQIDALKKMISQDTLLVSIQAANNEIGTIQEIKELTSIAHAHGAVFHCDAVQAVGKIAFNVVNLGVDLVSMSSHKMYGPKGIGAIDVKGAKKTFS